MVDPAGMEVGQQVGELADQLLSLGSDSATSSAPGMSVQLAPEILGRLASDRSWAYASWHTTRVAKAKQANAGHRVAEGDGATPNLRSLIFGSAPYWEGAATPIRWDP